MSGKFTAEEYARLADIYDEQVANIHKTLNRPQDKPELFGQNDRIIASALRIASRVTDEGVFGQMLHQELHSPHFNQLFYFQNKARAIITMLSEGER